MEIYNQSDAHNHEELSYIHLLRDVMNHGIEKEDRTGVGIKELSCRQLRFDLSNNKFPLLTTKKLFLKGIIHELLWFIKGDTNVKYLQDNDVHIWDEWCDKNGNLGKVYGYQWRKWNGEFDQLSDLINQIKLNPNSRRHIITAWNPSDIKDCKLPPCHCFMQFIVRNGYFPKNDSYFSNSISCKLIEDYNEFGLYEGINKSGNLDQETCSHDEFYQGKLDCMLTQRSGDLFLGVPFNIASYSLFTKMIAKVCNLEPGEFIHTINSAHIYKNHYKQVVEQMIRTPHDFPKLVIKRDITNIDDFKFEDFELIDYKCHPAIKAPVAV